MHRPRPRRIAAAAAFALVASVAAPGLAAQPARQSVTVPAAGSTAEVTWTGTIPPGANPSGDCTAEPSASSDVEEISVGVPSGLYDTTTASFAFTIEWDPSTGGESTNDEILTVVGPGGEEAGSSDGGTTTETVTASDLVAGDYQIQACGFANAAPQDYSGTLTITSAPKTPGPPAPAQSGPRVAFGVPRIVDPIHTYGEPDIKVGPSKRGKPGAVVVSGPAGTGTQRSVWNISVDNGDSWRLVQDLPQGAAPAVVPAKETNGPGGGDTEVQIARNGTIYYSDLYDLRCFTAAVTPDNGSTVQSNPNGCSGNLLADRQWYGLFDPRASDRTVSPYEGKKLLYLTFNDITSGAHVSKSTDGLNFTDAGEYGNGAGKYHYSVADSPLVVDQHTGDVLAAVIGDQNRMGLAVGKPDAGGNLNFGYVPVTGPRAGNEATLFPVIAEDRARNLYIAWVEDCGTSGSQPEITNPECFHVFYTAAHAATGWRDWSAPVRVDSAPSRTAVMPWITAGADGIVDIVWYGANRRENPSTVDERKPRSWKPYMVQIIRADSRHPRFRQAAVSPRPTHYNSICLLGTGCITANGDRNLADFFQVTIDNDGRARVVYNDTSNGLIQPGFEPGNGALDHAGAALVNVAIQNKGVDNLTGKRLRPFESTRPRAAIRDPWGDALVGKPLGGARSKGGDIRRVHLDLAHKKLHVRVRTSGASLGSAASDAGAPFGQLVVRWQMGRKLYYAEVEQDAAGAATGYFAGKTQSIDLCSVSACDPHYLSYPGPPGGGTEVTGKIGEASGKGVVYEINIPVADVGKPRSTSLLREVAAYVFVAPQSARQTVSNAQAQAEQGIPLEIEGTRTFNFRARR
jgi:hypothetical protein